MDANKLRVLQSIDYAVSACGVCRHAEIAPGRDWGTCRAKTYEHQKHTDTTRQLSIFRYGRCGDFEAEPNLDNYLDGFAEFLPEEVTS